MKATPENVVKKIVKKFLDDHGFYWYSAAAGPYSVAGIPDIVGHYRGWFVGIEVKKPGGKATALQLRQKNLIEEAGGKWFLVDGITSLEEVSEWIKLKSEPVQTPVAASR